MAHSRASLVLLVSALAAGCGSLRESEEGGSDGAKAAKKARAVELASRKVDQARVAQRVSNLKHGAETEQAKREMDLAAFALEQFTKNEAPLRVRKAELELQGKSDNLAENMEEFEQLKLMYAEQDLADKTREMVIHRTERRLEQSRKEVELARAQLEQLQSGELAQERAKLELALQEKKSEFEVAKAEAIEAQREGEVKMLEAEHELADAKEEAKDDAKEGAGGKEDAK